MITVDSSFVGAKLKKRDRDAHKGNFGKVLVFAGSVGMAGAGILCARAALRSGAGLVRILMDSPDSPLYQIFQTSVPEATCVFYRDIKNSENRIDFNEYDSIAAGPGLGKSDSVKQVLEEIICSYNGTLVLDADALNIISADEKLAEAVRVSGAKIIMTPHIGEARRLLGDESVRIKTGEERECAVTKLSRKYSCTAVLKGAGTLIAGDFQEIYINTTGNPGMATGGSGDVLAGIIASLAGQKYSPEDAACIGTFIHGLAGDLAAEKLGEVSMLSSDIELFIAEAFKTL